MPPDLEWPDEAGWERLRGADTLAEEQLDLVGQQGSVELEVPLPMPGVARLRFVPGG